MSVEKSNKKTLIWSFVTAGISIIWIGWMLLWNQPEFEGQLPAQLSTTSVNTDWVYYFIFYWSVLFFIGVIGTMGWFMWKYMRKSNTDRSEFVEDNPKFELFWVVFPTLLVTVVFILGARDFVDQRVVPPNAYEIQATAFKWGWSFSYPNGATSEELVIPAGTPVKMRLKSNDVLHSFYIPRFRIKQDVIHNRETHVWFQANDPTTPDSTLANVLVGNYEQIDGIYKLADGKEFIPPHTLFCTEYCGLDHSKMHRKVHVMPKDKFDQWVQDNLNGEAPSVERGMEIFNLQCVACHSVDGTPKNNGGPTWKGLFGSSRQFEDGTSLVADENYITESIYDPQAKIVQGYLPLMSSFQGILPPNDVESIIMYMKTLSDN